MASGKQLKPIFRGTLDELAERIRHVPDSTATKSRFTEEAAELAQRNQRIEELAVERAGMRGGGSEPTPKDFEWARARASGEPDSLGPVEKGGSISPFEDPKPKSFMDYPLPEPEAPAFKSVGLEGATNGGMNLRKAVDDLDSVNTVADRAKMTHKPKIEDTPDPTFNRTLKGLGTAGLLGGGAAAYGAAGSDLFSERTRSADQVKADKQAREGRKIGDKDSPFATPAQDPELAKLVEWARGTPRDRSNDGQGDGVAAPAPLPDPGEEPKTKPKGGTPASGGGKSPSLSPPPPPKTGEEADSFMAMFERLAGSPQFQNAMFTGAGAEAKRDKFDDELALIRETYADAKTNLEKRELAHTLAEALTQLGAGKYGANTGVDMSALKFSKRDFTKDFELLQQEMKTSLDDLKGRREANTRDKMHADDMALKTNAQNIGLATEISRRDMDKQKLGAEVAMSTMRDKTSRDIANLNAGVQARGQDMMNEYRMAMLGAKEERDTAVAESRKQQAWDKLVSDTGKGISGIMAMTAYQKNEEARSAAIIGQLARIGVPPDEARAAVEEKGLLWGSNPRSAGDIMNATNELMAKYRTRPESERPQQVVVKTDDGSTIEFPSATNARQAIAEAKKQGYKWTLGN